MDNLACTTIFVLSTLSLALTATVIVVSVKDYFVSKRSIRQ